MAESDYPDKRTIPRFARNLGDDAYIPDLYDATKEDLRIALWAALGASEYKPDEYKGRTGFTKDQLVALIARVWMLQNPNAYPDELNGMKERAEKSGEVTLPEIENWYPDETSTKPAEESNLPDSVYLKREQRSVYVALTRNRVERNKIAESRSRDRAIAAVADTLGEEYHESFDHGVHVHLDEIFRVDNGRCDPLGGPDFVDTVCPECGGQLVYTRLGRREKGSGIRDAECVECGEEIEAKRKTCVTIRK